MITKYDRRMVAVLTLIAMAVLMGLQYFIQVSANEDRAMTTARVLIGQVEKILDNNETSERYIANSLKEDYMQRANAISIVLKYNPGGTKDSRFMAYMAEVMGVDEVHIIDDTGTIVGGSHPQYYGLNFEDGTQIGYFKPMLSNRTLSLCQDVTPNTAEGKPMMYAIVWNPDGTYMVQVGVKPVRLLNYLYTTEISEVVKAMPAFEGMGIVIADAESDRIMGSTIEEMDGKTLQDFGIHVSRYVGQKEDEVVSHIEEVNGQDVYCNMSLYEKYRIVILQDYKVVQDNVKNSLLVLFVYLAIAAVIINRVLRRMFTFSENSRRDPMTGLLNRRSYDQMIQKYLDSPLDDEMVALSFDLNGLKEANDVLGHEMGDLLIRGAGECLSEVFSERGRVFRVGGDEFTCILWMNREEQEKALQELRERIDRWNQEQDQVRLAVAVGTARHDDYPDDTIDALFRRADQGMYEDKRLYYQQTGKDRRKR